VVIAQASKISTLGIDNGMNLWSFPPALLSGVWRLTAGIVS